MTACSVHPCVATTVNYTTHRRTCCLLPAPPLCPVTLDMIFCLWISLPHFPHSPLFQLSNPLSSACRARLLPFQFSSPPSHHCRRYYLPLHPLTVTTSQPPRSALCCVPLRDSCFTFPWFFFSRKHTPSLSLQYKIRRHFQEEVRHIHLHSGQRFRHHAADGDLATPCR